MPTLNSCKLLNNSRLQPDPLGECPSFVDKMCSKNTKIGPKIAPKTLLKTVNNLHFASTIMSTKKQQFYGESKLNFFLRDPKRIGPRLVYLSTYIGGKHYVVEP